MCLQMGFKNVECWKDPNLKRQTAIAAPKLWNKGLSPLCFSLLQGTIRSNLSADLTA